MFVYVGCFWEDSKIWVNMRTHLHYFMAPLRGNVRLLATSGKKIQAAAPAPAAAGTTESAAHVAEISSEEMARGKPDRVEKKDSAVFAFPVDHDHRHGALRLRTLRQQPRVSAETACPGKVFTRGTLSESFWYEKAANVQHTSYS